MKKKLSPITVALLIIMFVLVLFPLGRMLFYMTGAKAQAVLTSPRFHTALLNSVVVSLVSTVISVAVALCLSYAIARSNIRFKGLFTILFMLPIFIPSMSHGMGLILLFGSNGIFTHLFGLSGNIYGFSGIVLGSFMYSFPFAYLMISETIKFEDSSPYEAASILGIPKFRQFLAISWPYIRKPLIVSAFATFTMIITDYGVPLMIGGQYITLSVMLYEDVIGLLDFAKGSVIGFVLLIPAVISFIIDLRSKDRGNQSYIIKPFRPAKNKKRDAVAYGFCVLVSLFVLLPITAFCVMAFVTKYPTDMSFTWAHVNRALELNMMKYLVNSLIIAVCTALMGVVISVFSGYMTARNQGRGTRLLHLLSITSLAIPGIVLGLAYVLTFSKTPIYGTLVILVFVNFAHYFSQPYLMMYNSFSKQNSSLEAVGATLGVSKWRILKDVLLPQNKTTIVEMFSYLFVNSMMTISAVSFLATVSTKPIAVMMTTFDVAILLSCSSVISVVILAVNLLMRGGVYLYKRKTAAKEA